MNAQKDDMKKSALEEHIKRAHKKDKYKERMKRAH